MKLLSTLFLALIGSIVANLAILFLLRPIVINKAMPLQVLGVAPVVVFTTGGVLGATATYALMRMLMTKPDKLFMVLSIATLFLSCIPDYLIIGQTTGKLAGANMGCAVTLMLMHVATAFIAVWSLTKLWGSRLQATQDTPTSRKELR